jgi:hypothetical protein
MAAIVTILATYFHKRILLFFILRQKIECFVLFEMKQPTIKKKSSCSQDRKQSEEMFFVFFFKKKKKKKKEQSLTVFNTSCTLIGCEIAEWSSGPTPLFFFFFLKGNRSFLAPTSWLPKETFGNLLREIILYLFFQNK